MPGLYGIFFSNSNFRSDSENSLSSEPSSQFLAMSKLPPPPFNGAGGPTGMPAGLTESMEKDNNKNNLLLAMLWLQRHREIMSLSQQNDTTSKVSDFRELEPTAVTFRPYLSRF